MDAGQVNEPVWLVALQQKTQTDNMPTHTTPTTAPAVVEGTSTFSQKKNEWRRRRSSEEEEGVKEEDEKEEGQEERGGGGGGGG